MGVSLARQDRGGGRILVSSGTGCGSWVIALVHANPISLDAIVPRSLSRTRSALSRLGDTTSPSSLDYAVNLQSSLRQMVISPDSDVLGDGCKTIPKWETFACKVAEAAQIWQIGPVGWSAASEIGRGIWKNRAAIRANLRGA